MVLRLNGGANKTENFGIVQFPNGRFDHLRFRDTVKDVKLDFFFKTGTPLNE
jgi:hypothetical protein